jgi:hypothetical protein
VYLAVAVYSFIAGLRLWRIEPGAPEFAKTFIIASGTSIIVIFLVLNATAGTSVDLTKILVHRALWSTVWYLYLCFSDRVRITYGPVSANQPPVFDLSNQHSLTH